MNIVELKEKIISLLSLVLECQIDEYSSKENTLTWDSLNHARVLIELNEVFDIRIPFADYDKLNSVEEITRYLNEIKQNNSIQ